MAKRPPNKWPQLLLYVQASAAFGSPNATERARMKFSSVLLIFASSLIVGCAGSSPISPDAANTRAIASTPASAAQVFFPPIEPAGISCPSDAPQLWVGSLGSRMDIEFSEVNGAHAYEIEIVDRNLTKVRLEVPAPAHRAEWYAWPGIFRIRIRTLNCGGTGKWSADFEHSINDLTPPPPPVPGPQCMVAGCEPPPVPGPQCMVGGCEPPPVPGPQCVHACEPPPPPCVECDGE
jgi:hypothetical protein